VRLWTEFTWLRIESHVSPCERGNEPWDSIKDGEFCDQLRDCQLLMKDSDAWSCFAIFEVLTAVNIQVAVFWVVTPYSDRVGYQSFGKHRTPNSQRLAWAKHCKVKIKLSLCFN
jgi:hypothetical protein